MKQPGYRRTRDMEMKFLFECPRCSKEKAICFGIPLVEDDKYVYTQWVGQSSSPYLVKLPAVNMSVNEQGNYIVEDIFENLGGGKSAPISSERLKGMGLVIECLYCGEKEQFVLGVGIIRKTEGGILLQKRLDIPEVLSLPIVLLTYDRKGNLNVVTFLNPTPKLTTDTGMTEFNLKSAEDYNRHGADYYLKQQYKLAIADFTKAIELNPSFSGAFHNRGLAFRDEGQYASAILDFNRAIELSPDRIAYFNRGLAYSAIGLYDLSIADLSKAIELDNKFARAYYERSCCYYNQRKNELSLKDLDKVIEVSDDPKLIQFASEAKCNMESKMS